MLIVVCGGISFFLFNREYEDGTDPIFCKLEENPGINADVLDQMMFALMTCERNFSFDLDHLHQALSSPNYLIIPIERPVSAFNERPVLKIAAYIVEWLVLAHYFRAVKLIGVYRLIGVRQRDLVASMMDLTCVHVTISSHADLTELAIHTQSFIYTQQQHGCICQPRHLIIRGATEEKHELHIHYLDRRIRDIRMVVDEFSIHLRTLFVILTAPNHTREGEEPLLKLCILYGRRACDIFPDIFRTDTILTLLPDIVKLMNSRLRELSSPNPIQNLDVTSINLIRMLQHAVNAVKINCPADDVLSGIILSEALIILSTHCA